MEYVGVTASKQHYPLILIGYLTIASRSNNPFPIQKLQPSQNKTTRKKQSPKESSIEIDKSHRRTCGVISPSPLRYHIPPEEVGSIHPSRCAGNH
ncbi:hypothetical protein JTE90_011543 [Oedothorax gibbosus]|uniref:Uncharacterized protein n=1 Tax=Oedothorax gibbosus TaxID=931172 RepID=A0AAV6UIN9_9ARAC|nr:hypothetical protein JTE90_011543 [Oedothorax gibbosus]